jgi:flavin-dependent dehydrogenase
MFDLVVVGGGPAGSAAAITAARQGARVLLLEAGKYPRHKVCGEFVSAESVGLLRSLLKDTQLLELRTAMVERIGRGRLFVDGTVLEASIDPPAASIARIDLDAALWDAALAAGIDARLQQRVQRISGSGPFVVSSPTDQFEAKCVINASGRWSNLTAAKGTETKGSDLKWLGLKAHFEEPAGASSVDLYFFESGYCGVQPLGRPAQDGKTRINACAMVRPDAGSSLHQVFSRHPALQERSQQWSQVSDLVTTSPLIFRKPTPEGGGILLAGDAAGFVDPFVGDGISLALRSGAMAADSLGGFFAGSQSLSEACVAYREGYRRELLPVFRTSSRIRRLFSLPRTIRIPVARLFQRAPALTDYLVRKTR